MTKTVVIATNNAHKVEEIKIALNFEGWEFKSLKDAGLVSDPEESGTTFLENARIKARAAHELACAAVLADDSGLIVDALDGAPGVYSSRYSGVDGDDSANNAKLLRELSAVPLAKRTARFAMAYWCLLMRMASKRSLKALWRGTSALSSVESMVLDMILCFSPTPITERLQWRSLPRAKKMRYPIVEMLCEN